MIPNDFIQTLLSRVDIVSLIDSHLPLKKAGANYQACCPFHSEKSPSFTVSPTKQFYHCFGCGAHGTAIGFLIEYSGKSFPDAVEELARDAGLEVPRSTPQDDSRREAGAHAGELLLRAAKFYRTRLRESPRAIAYLKERGLTGDIAARFGIGYAPDDWQPLAAAVPYADKALETAGLVVTGDSGKRYDRFRDRIMFPIHDQSGRVIGFGGRILDKGEPKYLNSPETPLFSKGRELYGLFQARPAIRTAGMVVVVEGYMDVVALAQHGVEYAVATLGTATTPLHAQKLLRATDRVVFCFDGDAAGRRAAWRALENALPVVSDGKSVSFLFLPDGEDPDDAVRKRGKDAFEALIGKAIPLSDFLLKELASRHPPTTAEGMAALVNAAKPLLAQLRAPVLAALMRRRLAELAGLREAELATLAPSAPAPSPRSTPTKISRAAVVSMERQLLRAVVSQPSLVREIDFKLPESMAVERSALSFIRHLAEEGDPSTGSLLQASRGTPHAALLDELTVEILAWDDGFDVNAQFAGALDKLRRAGEDEAFRAMMGAGGIDALSPEQRKRLSNFRQPDAKAPDR